MPTQVCSKCSSVNPAEASYCYFDGTRLTGSGHTGPINAATQSFPIPFTFPSGLVCRNFDQFATACQDNWQSAIGLLKDGFLANFFGGMGRADLAMAAQEAAKNPDHDRGLDHLLEKLPTKALAAPKLKIDPVELNLGQASIGSERTLQVHLANTGTRLLYGTIASDSKWLSLGDAPGHSQKLFQFGSETVIPVNLRGQHLRAGNKPLEGQLLVESNGGPATVMVRVTVQITPFKDGIFAGSTTPRQVAEKARANPAAAAPYFEQGAVAEWFKSNGWIYPVQGPAANGLGAVQQFFEALGLAKAPKVQVGQQAIMLQGAPGQSLQSVIEVSTQEKKPVYAHATCEQPWVDVSKVSLAGRRATITVAIPSVPNRSGETLQAKILIAGNGNQRFSVPLSLTISGTAVANVAPPSSNNPFADLSHATTPGAPAPSPSVVRPGPASSAPVAVFAPPMNEGGPSGKRKSIFVHLLPLLLLLLGVAVLPAHDWLATPPPPDLGEELIASGVDIDPRPRLTLRFDSDKLAPSKQDAPIVHNNMNFGLLSLNLDDPKNPKYKKLLYGERGQTNNTLVRLDDQDETFGKPGTGKWLVEPRFKTWERINPPLQKEGVGVWDMKGVIITQSARIIPGEPVEVAADVYKSHYDTCLVTYKIENKDSKSHVVGLRVMLDTLIGDNDGVPFTIPGQPTLITKKLFKDDFNRKIKEVPDFIMALEQADLANPGTVVQLNLHLSEKLESPSRVLLTRWPGALKTGAKARLEAMEKWDIPLTEIEDDSSIVMYWPPEQMQPGGMRELGYSYGLGSFAATKGGQLAVTIGGVLTTGGELSVVALVNNAKAGEKVTLELPKELALLPDSKAEQPVLAPEGNRPRPTTWRLKSNASGAFTITVRTGGGLVQKKRVVIRSSGIF